MNIQIFPNWFKWVGVLLFWTFFIVGGLDDFLDGYNSAGCNCVEKYKIDSVVDKGDYYECPNGSKFNKSKIFRNKISDTTRSLMSAFSGLALLLILLSREKIEDEYIKRLRLEAFQLTTIAGLLLCFFLLVFDANMKTFLMYIIYSYVIIYLLIFNIKLKISKI